MHCLIGRCVHLTVFTRAEFYFSSRFNWAKKSLYKVEALYQSSYLYFRMFTWGHNDRWTPDTPDSSKNERWVACVKMIKTYFIPHNSKIKLQQRRHTRQTLARKKQFTFSEKAQGMHERRVQAFLLGDELWQVLVLIHHYTSPEHRECRWDDRSAEWWNESVDVAFKQTA